MEREWWLKALLGLVALVGLMLLALFTVGLLDPNMETEPAAVAPEPSIEVSFYPGRAVVGVGAALVFFGTALWVVKRTDWSLDDPLPGSSNAAPGSPSRRENGGTGPG